MECQVWDEHGLTVLALRGKLDSFSAKDFEDQLLRLIEGGARKLIIDCAQLEYVSSAGLRIFYLAANRLQSVGGKIVFCAVQDDIKRVFDIVDLSSEFLILPARAQAVQQFQDNNTGQNSSMP